MRRHRPTRRAAQQQRLVALALATTIAVACSSSWSTLVEAAPFDPFARLKGAVPSFKVTYDHSDVGDQSKDVCTASNAFTRPQLAKVQVCAKSKAYSANGAGLVTSFSNATLDLTNQASTACAEAVGNGVKGLCEGGDPMATLSAISSVCASALVQLQASTISGVAITAATDVPMLSPSKKAYALACADGCVNAQTSAEAVAQASACAWVKASKGCNAVQVALSSQNYAQAFIKTTAAAWSNTCALGFGRSTSTGEAAAATTADVIARAVGEVVAAACSNCDTCKCAPLPPGWSYEKSKDLSRAAATAVAGQFTMAKAISQAVGAYCDSDKSQKAIQASVNTTLNTMAVALANVLLKTSATATAEGGAMACAGGSISQQVRAVKVAYVNALTDASATVFDHYCAAAQSRMKTMVNSLYDTIDEAFESLSSKCAQGDAGGGKFAAGGSKPVTVSAADEVKKVLTASKPVTAAIGEALQDAVACGCKPGKCFWCTANDADKQKTSSSVSAFDLGGGTNVTKSGPLKQPLNWNQLAKAAGSGNARRRLR